MDGTGANEFSLEELEELFKEETQPTTPAANDDTTEPQNTDGKETKTRRRYQLKLLQQD